MLDPPVAPRDKPCAWKHGLEDLNPRVTSRGLRGQEARCAKKLKDMGTLQPLKTERVGHYSGLIGQGWTRAKQVVFAKMLRGSADDEDPHRSGPRTRIGDGDTRLFWLSDHPASFSASVCAGGACAGRGPMWWTAAAPITSRDGFRGRPVFLGLAGTKGGSPYDATPPCPACARCIEQTLRGEVARPRRIKSRGQRSRNARRASVGDLGSTFDNEGSEIYTIQSGAIP